VSVSLIRQSGLIIFLKPRIIENGENEENRWKGQSECSLPLIEAHVEVPSTGFGRSLVRGFTDMEYEGISWTRRGCDFLGKSPISGRTRSFGRITRSLCMSLISFPQPDHLYQEKATPQTSFRSCIPKRGWLPALKMRKLL
jgi:hypothetical protein